MQRQMTLAASLAVLGLSLTLTPPAWAKAKAGCPTDSVQSGPTCIDKYEASVWNIPPAQAGLIGLVTKGTATLADLTAGGATQLGLAAGDLAAAGCPATGNGCTDVYAVSLPGVTPSRYLTWFQAAAAARNSGKRLPTNAEWQAAALGTPDGAPCLVFFAGGPGPTGTVGCVSDVGAFDMVGNFWEWVADWVPQSTDCVTALFGTGDSNCLAGASTMSGPGALIRGGGSELIGAIAGVFAVSGSFGFRAAR